MLTGPTWSASDAWICRGPSAQPLQPGRGTARRRVADPAMAVPPAQEEFSFVRKLGGLTGEEGSMVLS